jgi:hypothetical protein
MRQVDTKSGVAPNGKREKEKKREKRKEKREKRKGKREMKGKP